MKFSVNDESKNQGHTKNVKSEAITTQNIAPSSGSINQSNDLVELLWQSITGVGLLQQYKNNGTFTPAARLDLAEIVVNNEIRNSPKYKIPAERFLRLAKVIAKTFPTETENTYYIAYMKNKVTGERVLAKGKLYDKYCQLRSYLRESGVVESEQVKKKRKLNKSIVLGFEENVISLSTTFEEDSDLNEKCLWLGNFTEPWQKVEKLWEETSKYRIGQLVYHNITPMDYTNKYKVLQQSLGYNLIDIDFSKIYPDKKLKLFAEWVSFEKQLVKYCGSIKKSDKSTKHLIDLINSIDETSSSNTSSAAVLRLLPLLLPAVSIKLGKKQLWRPSKAEIQNSFLLHVKNLIELENELSARRNLLRQYNLSEQPLAVIIGESLSRIETSLVCINDIKYHVRSPLAAIDITFKSFFALQSSFPREAELPWMVLQRRLYDIRGENDKTLPSVETFLKDLSRY